MELLDQPIYSGPPPRYTAGDTVYYHGLSYTVERVVGRAPTVGWVYELDGPGELIRVGEGEISSQAGRTHISQLAVALPHGTSLLHPKYQGVTPLWPFVAATTHMISQVLSVPPVVLAGHHSSYGDTQTAQTIAQKLLDQQREWAWQALRDALCPPQQSAAAMTAALRAAATAAEPIQPPPRLNRAARRAKHRPWTPPAR